MFSLHFEMRSATESLSCDQLRPVSTRGVAVMKVMQKMDETGIQPVSDGHGD